MSILNLQIVLPVSQIGQVMTTLIANRRHNETLQKTGLMSSLVDAMTYDRVEFGKGIVRSQKLKRQPQNNLTKGSNPFELSEPNVGEEVIIIDNYKVIPLSTSDILTRDIGVNNAQISNYLSSVDALLQETKDMNLYKVALENILSWVPTSKQKKVVNQIINNNSADDVNINKINAQRIAKDIRNSIISLSRPSGDFIDVTSYKVDNIEIKDLETIATRDDLILFVNSEFNTNMIVDAYSTLYNFTKIQDIVGAIIEVAVDDIPQEYKNVIAWIAHKDKFAIAYFYDTVLSIQNPSDTYLNKFMHYAYGTGVFKLLPCIQLIAEFDNY